MLQHASVPAGCLLQHACSLEDRAAADCTYMCLTLPPHVSLACLDLSLGSHLTSPSYISLQTEAAKWQELRPYLVSSPKRGVIGNSRYAKRLRSQILAAAKAGNRSATQL